MAGVMTSMNQVIFVLGQGMKIIDSHKLLGPFTIRTPLDTTHTHTRTHARARSHTAWAHATVYCTYLWMIYVFVTQ